MPIKSYKCIYCKKNYDTYKEAKECEERHLIVNKIVKSAYNLEKYPTSLDIEFNDGSVEIICQKR